MYDLQWRKFSAYIPRESQNIFIKVQQGFGELRTEALQCTKFCKKLLDYNSLFYGETWCDAEPVVNAPEGFDPAMAGKMCLCGHAYHRHFDSYEGWAPVGCKYCHGYVEGVSHRKETKPPEGLTDAEWNAWWSANKDTAISLCDGFKEDPDAEPEECEWAERLANAGRTITI